VAADATAVRAHQNAARARHQPPGDVDPARLAPAVLASRCVSEAPTNDKSRVPVSRSCRNSSRTSFRLTSCPASSPRSEACGCRKLCNRMRPGNIFGPGRLTGPGAACVYRCTASKCPGRSDLRVSLRRFCDLVVLVNHATEYLLALHGHVKRHDDRLIVIGTMLRAT